jgi:hypothetical protein
MKTPLLLLLAAALMGVVTACSADTVQTKTAVPEVTDAAVEAEGLPLEFPLIEGPVSADGLKLIFATPDLSVGEHRVGFAVTSTQSLVQEPVASVSSTYYPEGDVEGQAQETAVAIFRPWPYGTRGIYTTSLEFDLPGRWGIEVTVLSTEGPSRKAELLFSVAEAVTAPAVGTPAIKSESKTIHDVERISQLTTGSLHDPDLYQTTISGAIDSGLPTVVVMASPAFCTNAVCGPQVEVLKELKDKYRAQANFIHVDFYDNPEEIQGDLNRARTSPTVEEWRLPSTEWSFVIDDRGVISSRFESFATLEELERALRDVL